DEHTVMQQLQTAFAAVPHATGVNNHMGSLVTQHESVMRWFMSSLLCRRDAYFIDSYTTADSVALRTAHDVGLPANRRHVFLDTDPEYEAVLDSLDRLVRRAHRDGVAVAIGHPLPDTLRALEQTLPDLAAAGVELVRPRDVVHVPDRDLPPDLVSASW
ncbi:MAG: divergent polysaccharide deacetylase family protein, partial [Pseudomonadota bacterium]